MYSNASNLIGYSKPREGKDRYWSTLRGICILCVIIFHLPLPAADGQIPLEYWLLCRIVSFPVAVFFAMAGYFVRLERSADKKYLRGKIMRLLIPYLLFTAVYLVRSGLETAFNWKGVVAAFLLGTAELQMYFCPYLIQMILLLPLLCKLLADSKRRLIWLMLFGALSMIWAYLRSYLHLIPGALSVLCVPYLFYYVLGLFLKMMEREHCTVKMLSIYRWHWLLVTGGLVIALAETYARRLTMQVSLGNYVYCTALILVLFAIKWHKHPEIEGNFAHTLAWLGECSFGVYLIHMLPMRAAYVLEKRLPYPWLQLADFALALAGSVFLIWVIRTVFRDQKWLELIGF